MAVSVLKRPQGYILTSQPQGAGVTNVSGKARFRTQSAHGLITGNHVYIKSTVAEYNGLWYVEVHDTDEFYIKADSAAARQAYYKNIVFEWWTTTAHSWNCIHLPIQYKLSSTLWPTNSADTARTISGVTDSNSYCALALSGDIKATGSAAALEYVKITGASDSSLNGVWQIIAYTNETTFTIEIPYTSANDTALTGASIQYYYNSYHVKVQVWGGLNNGHVYYGQEPYELLSTLSLIPDSDGVCQFSIHEILKKNIAIKNNLLLGTLPNNLDAWTGFFIKYCEVYDDSDGTTLSTLAESYTSDLSSFEGYAVNAILPFKNVYSGNLSEYLMNRTTAKFLTLFSIPVLFSGCYNDVSFIYDDEDLRPQFTNQDFESSIADWSSLSGSDRSLDAAFTWNSAGGGSAFADGTSGSAQQTKYFAIERSPGHAHGWPPGSYTIDIVVSNASDDTNAITPQVFGMMDASSQTGLGASASPSTVPDGGADTPVTLTFTTAQYWKYFALAFARSGPPGSFIMKVYIRSATVTSAPSSDLSALVLRQKYYANGVLQTTDNNDLSGASFSRGVYRAPLDVAGISDYDRVDISLVKTVNSVEETISETLQYNIDSECLKSKATGYNIGWLNYLGGFDWWQFKEYSDHAIEITDSGETEENTFPDWPNSYGEFADTIRKQTHRKSRRMITVRSQNLTLEQLQAIEYIKTSPLVQIVNSIYDRRTVLVDTDSFTSYREGQKEQYTITFTITYTDDVPSQTV